MPKLGTVASIPNSVRLCYQDWPDREGVCVEFRLIYEGALPAEGSGGTRRKEKHAIRRELHRQLKELWQQHSMLSRWLVKEMPSSDNPPIDNRISHCDTIADNYAKCGFRFVPLINRTFGIACALDILFLRRDDPGNLVRSGGDIDNRIKVLFDALRLPQECHEVAGFSVGPNEDPMFCLMENDDLITEVKITTDRLLTPAATASHIHDVILVINVKSKVVDSTRAYAGFYP